MKTNRTGSVVALALMGILGGALVGCVPDFDHLEMSAVTNAPLAVSIGPTNVAFPVGIAVGLTATPFDIDGEIMDPDVELSLISANPRVLGVEALSKERSFVFFASGPGTTTIAVQVDHLTRFEIPVTVKLQPTE